LASNLGHDVWSPAKITLLSRGISHTVSLTLAEAGDNLPSFHTGKTIFSEILGIMIVLQRNTHFASLALRPLNPSLHLCRYPTIDTLFDGIFSTFLFSLDGI
jgi:hypothetical protein